MSATQTETPTDAPYSDALIRRYNALTHWPTEASTQNARFREWSQQLRAHTVETLARYGVEEIPADVLAAEAAVRRAEVHFFEALVRAREIAPPVTVVGPANYRGKPERAQSIQRAALEACKKAQERLTTALRRYSPRATISSDDPDAPEKLAARIAKLEADQAQMKAANRILRWKGVKDEAKVLALQAEGLPESVARELLTPDQVGRTGFAPWMLTNNNANIRRLRERLELIQRQRLEEEMIARFDPDALPDVEEIVDNVAANRVQIAFFGKPDAEVRDRLKARGFHWSPSAGVWQRQRGQAARDAVADVLGVRLAWEPFRRRAEPTETDAPLGPWAGQPVE